MTPSEAAPLEDEEVRREPSLRIVHVKNSPELNGQTERSRPLSWQGTPVRPYPLPNKRDAMLDRGLQARIGGMLRDVFSDLAEAPVPDRFVKLLEALEAKETLGE